MNLFKKIPLNRILIRQKWYKNNNCVETDCYSNRIHPPEPDKPYTIAKKCNRNFFESWRPKIPKLERIKEEMKPPIKCKKLKIVKKDDLKCDPSKQDVFCDKKPCKEDVLKTAKVEKYPLPESDWNGEGFCPK